MWFPHLIPCFFLSYCLPLFFLVTVIHPRHFVFHKKKQLPCASGRVVGWRWLSYALSRARSFSGQYSSSTISTSSTVSRTSGSQGNKCLTSWRWSMTSFNGVSQRSRPPQPCRGPRGASVLTSCVTSPLLPTCRLTGVEAEDPDIVVNDIYTLPAADYICKKKKQSARYPDLAPCQDPDPQQPSRSLTDLLTTLAANLELFQVTGSLLSRVSSGVPASGSAWPKKPFVPYS